MDFFLKDKSTKYTKYIVHGFKENDSKDQKAVAYPELVLGGGFQSHKFKGMVKVGAIKGVVRVYLEKNRAGVFPSNQKTPLDTPLFTSEGNL